MKSGSPIALFFAAALSVTYFSTLLDTPQRQLVVLPATTFVQPPPEESVPRAPLTVEVVDEQGALVPGASVAVYWIRDRLAYSAGLQISGELGVATLEHVPLGELWVMVEAPGRQRASTRLVLGPEGARSQVTLRRAHRLVVQVVDEMERAVAGATVEVRGSDPLPCIGKSKENGAVEFSRLGPGPWFVRASLPGFEAAAKSGVRAGLLPQRITLRSLGALAVSVKNPDGSPAAKATVEVAGSGLWPARTATTDENGNIRIAALPAGAYNVFASRENLVSETNLGIPVQRGEPTALTLQLGQGHRVAIRVVDDGGDDALPVPGAEVVLAEEGLSSFPRRALTNKNGELSLGPVGARPVVLGVRAEGFVPRTGVKIDPESNSLITVSLVRGGRIVGEIVDKNGDPIDGASIEIIGVDFSGMPVDETPEHMSFREAHFAWALTAPVSLIPAGELGVMPGPLPSIPRGRSISPVEPLAAPPNGSSTIVDINTPVSMIAPWVSGGDGSFRASPVPPGRLRALVRHPNYVEGLSDAVTVTPGGESKVRVQLQAGGTLEGRVVDGGGRPIAGARVQVAALHGTMVRSALTAEDGTFAFSAVPSEVTVSVARPDTFEDTLVKKEILIQEGERKEIELVLPEARDPIEIRVVDDRGYPLDNAQITALSLTVGTPLRTTRFTRGDGVAWIPDAAGLDLRLEVSLSGRAPRIDVFEKAAKELKITLKKASSLEGDIVAHRGYEYVEGAQISVIIGGLTRTTRTDKEGRFFMTGLPSGKARLTVQARGFAPAERSIQIAEPEGDRPSKVDRIELIAGGEVEGEVVDKNGDPVIGARVAQGVVPAFLPLGDLPPGITVTDRKGHFKLLDLPEGLVTLEAFAPDKGRGRTTNIQVSSDRPTSKIRIVLDTETSQSEPAGAGGVAVTLAERQESGKIVFYLRAVASGSEAERAGLEVDDELILVDDEKIENLEDLRKKLSGPVGDDIVLRLRRRGEVMRIRVARERVRR